MVVKTYRSQCGRHYFTFRFASSGQHFEIHCSRHPPLGDWDGSVSKTHLYSSGQICFVIGREPRTLSEAEQRAAEWAEYWLEYSRTGVPQ